MFSRRLTVGSRPFARATWYHTNATAPANLPYYKLMIEHPDYKSISVPTRKLLDTMRDHFLFRKLENAPRQQYFSEAYDAIALLTAPPELRESVTLGDVEEVLPPRNSRAWLAILDLINDRPSSQLAKRTEKEHAMCEFLRIYNVGKAFAAHLADAGLRTLEEVAAADVVNGRKISPSMKLSIERLPDMNHMIPRRELDACKARLEDVFYGHYEAPASFEIAGAYRCGEPYAPDINVVVWSEAYDDKNKRTRLLDHAYHRLVRSGMLHQDMLLSTWRTSNRRRIVGYTRLTPKGPWRLISFSLVPMHTLPFELVAQTGDSFMYRLLRSQAKLKGYRLSQTKLEKLDGSSSSEAGTNVLVESEKEIFDIIGVPYLEPHQRSYKVYKNIWKPSILDAWSEPWENRFLEAARRRIAKEEEKEGAAL